METDLLAVYTRTAGRATDASGGVCAPAVQRPSLSAQSRLSSLPPLDSQLGSGELSARPPEARSRQITTSVAKKIDTERLYRLRAAVRQCTTRERVRGCGRRAVRSEGPALEVRHLADGPQARWVGVLRCGRRWVCPVCADGIIARRRQQVIDALSAGRRAHPDREWRMLTLTIRHRASSQLEHTLRIRRAWRRCRQRGTVQRMWRAHVVASVRALEITDGPHGWHPHIHIAILTDAWSDDEWATLRAAWEECVAGELGEEYVPDAEHGMYVSERDSHIDGYLAKLGLEVTGAAKSRMGPWSHAERAAERYAVARRIRDRDERARVYEDGDRHRARYREYESATRGVRAIELDDRAAELARRGEQERCDPDYDAPPTPSAPSYEVDMTAPIETPRGPISMMRALSCLERSDGAILWRALRVAERSPPYGAADAIRIWLATELRLRYGDVDRRLEIC